MYTSARKVITVPNQQIMLKQQSSSKALSQARCVVRNVNSEENKHKYGYKCA